MAKKRKKKVPAPKRKVRVKKPPRKGILKRGFGSSGSSYNALRKKVWEENKDKFTNYRESLRASSFIYGQCKGLNELGQPCDDLEIKGLLEDWVENVSRQKPLIDEAPTKFWEIYERLGSIREAGYRAITVVLQLPDVQDKFDTNDYDDSFVSPYVADRNNAIRSGSIKTTPEDDVFYRLTERSDNKGWYYYVYEEEAGGIEFEKDDVNFAAKKRGRKPTVAEPTAREEEITKPTSGAETETDKKLKEQQLKKSETERVLSIVESNEKVIKDRQSLIKEKEARLDKLLDKYLEKESKILEKMMESVQSEINDIKEEVKELKIINTKLRKQLN